MHILLPVLDLGCRFHRVCGSDGATGAAVLLVVLEVLLRGRGGGVPPNQRQSIGRFGQVKSLPMMGRSGGSE